MELHCRAAGRKKKASMDCTTILTLFYAFVGVASWVWWYQAVARFKKKGFGKGNVQVRETVTGNHGIGIMELGEVVNSGRVEA